MSVSVEDRAHAIAVNRFLKAARSKVRKDLGRLSFHRGPHRRVVQQRHAPRRPQPRQRRFKLQCFVDRFLYEQLGGSLTPRSKDTTPESSRESLDSREADALYFRRLAVQDRDTGIGKDLPDL